MSHRMHDRSIYLNSIKRVTLACIAVVWFSARSESKLFYTFIEEDSGNVLATLELSSLPATPVNIASLTFTAEGQALLELEPEYNGNFEAIEESLIVDDGAKGLKCNGGKNVCGWIDRDPPTPSIPGTYWLNFAILFGEVDEPDRFAAPVPYSGGQSGEIQYFSFAVGKWRLVPEPSTVLLSMPVTLIVLGGRPRGATSRAK